MAGPLRSGRPQLRNLRAELLEAMHIVPGEVKSRELTASYNFFCGAIVRISPCVECPADTDDEYYAPMRVFVNEAYRQLYMLQAARHNLRLKSDVASHGVSLAPL